jgi:hypothetical protein
MQAQTSRSAVRAVLNRLICVPLDLMAVLGFHSHADVSVLIEGFTAT